MIWWLLSLSWASARCPRSDLYAAQLDAYTVVINENPTSFHFAVDSENGAASREVWRNLLQDCQRPRASDAFEDFVSAVAQLSTLGAEWERLDWWRRKQHWLLRKEITVQERRVAQRYVDFLRIFQQETGIAIRWKRGSHPLVKGMISTARGSDLVADYVASVWELQESPY